MFSMNVIFILTITIIFTIIRSSTTIAAQKNNVKTMLMEVINHDSEQIQNVLDEMDRKSYEVATTSTIINILTNTLSYEGEENYFYSHYNERSRMMQTMQLLEGMNYSDSSMNIFSVMGDYVMLDIYEQPLFSRKGMRQRSKMSSFKENGVNKYVEISNKDPYGRTDIPMFSYVRKISDGYRDLGYVEIQRIRDSLTEDMESPDNAMGIISLITINGDVMFTNDGQYEKWGEDLTDLNILNGEDIVETNFGGITYLVLNKELSKYGINSYVLMPRKYLSNQLMQELGLLMLQSLLMLIGMMVLNYLFARRLYKPLGDLQERMERYTFTPAGDGRRGEERNIEITPSLMTSKEMDGTMDEISTFNQVFSDMIGRIQKQNDELVQRKMSELQTAYQALCAQVNPHFLNNTLYLIGLKGEENNAPEILEMCSYLTQMMQYCTNMKKTEVSFAEEISYMNCYLHLMEYRYLEKMVCKEDIDSRVLLITIPKFILQPLVENCFEHGFKNSPEEKYIIEINLKLTNNGWMLEISDNGEGFTLEDTEKIYKDVELIRYAILNSDVDFFKETSGVGLINTYARLYISTQGRVDLFIGKSTLGGGMVKMIYRKDS